MLRQQRAGLTVPTAPAPHSSPVSYLLDTPRLAPSHSNRPPPCVRLRISFHVSFPGLCSVSSSSPQVRPGTAHATAQPLRQVKSDSDLDELLRKYEDLLDSRDALFDCEPGDRKMSLNTREGPRAAWRALPEFGPSTGLTSESENPLAASPTGRGSSPHTWADAIQFVVAPGMRLLKYLRGR